MNGPAAEPPLLDPAALVAVPTYRDHPATTASVVRGLSLGGAAVEVDVPGAAPWTLLLFLTTRCQGCLPLWAALSGDLSRPGPAAGEPDAGEPDAGEPDAGEPGAGGPDAGEPGVEVVVVTRESGPEDLLELGRLAPAGVPVIRAPEAWRAYRVSGPPFFVLVDGRVGRVVTEGVAWGWDQVAEHVRRARLGLGGPEVPRLSGARSPGAAASGAPGT